MNTLQDVDWSSIPAPKDDGGAAHLTRLQLPSVGLSATDGGTVDLSKLAGRTVVYIYPMTGRPDVPLPDNWDMIPGARGCTPQSCSFRDHYAELKALGVDHLFGLSTQDTEYQREATDRLDLPFSLLSDHDLAFGDAIRLPRFDAAGKTLYNRMTLVIDNGTINHVFYPVFPPDRSAKDVIDWLS